MFENLDVMRMAQAMAVHAGKRQTIVAQNIANSDTPGFRARDLPSFASVYETDSGELRTTRPGHVQSTRAEFLPMEDYAGREDPNGNTVSLEHQILKAGEVRHQHDLSLAIFKSSLDILRLSIGRR